MNNRNVVLKFAAFAIALSGVSAPAMADRSDDFEFADELDACVAALNNELDLDGVYRVRHIVTKTDPKGPGYALTIKTLTFSETDEKQYSAICVANGNNHPSRLTISQKKI